MLLSSPELVFCFLFNSRIKDDWHSAFMIRLNLSLFVFGNVAVFVLHACYLNLVRCHADLPGTFQRNEKSGAAPYEHCTSLQEQGVHIFRVAVCKCFSAEQKIWPQAGSSKKACNPELPLATAPAACGKF